MLRPCRRDGNLHLNIVKTGICDENWNYKPPEGIKEMLKLCASLGSIISGEHAISLAQRPHTGMALNQV
ncbi:hypothetical protein I2I11_01955 [Pontibacter sp. 172403-2]|uniref:hypothetical protein n=1 Tax=Pontibacter rufus TaxID=2791028 RepID=UPI0018AFAD90|nr:hypothetical protein [Pontibacter sp. 172403-2]MBF9252047.1 hypothetical protein [Pontibacter sp. 172403-2]